MCILHGKNVLSLTKIFARGQKFEFCLVEKKRVFFNRCFNTWSKNLNFNRYWSYNNWSDTEKNARTSDRPGQMFGSYSVAFSSTLFCSGHRKKVEWLDPQNYKLHVTKLTNITSLHSEQYHFLPFLVGIFIQEKAEWLKFLHVVKKIFKL